MTSFRRRARRAAAIAASACIGAAGVLALASPASAHHPTVHGEAVCDTTTGEWVITWTVENSEDDLTGEIKQVSVTPEADLTTIVEGATLPKSGDGPLTEQVRVGGDVTEASLSVTVHWIRNGGLIVDKDRAKVQLGGGCAATAPVVDSTSDCDSLTVTVTNPAEEPLTATVTSGEVTEELTVAPGETGEVTVDATEGTVATVTIGDQTTEVAWQQPEDCDEPQEGEGGGGDLPETGVPTGLVAGAAVLLLALGGGLYLVARRRRITFTA